MPIECLTVACLTDNYAYLLHDDETGVTVLIDAPEADPILTALRERNWTLSHILITHHHADHTQALPDILAAHPSQVIGAAADTQRLPPLTTSVAEGDILDIGGHPCHVFDVSGHTIGHIAFYFPDDNLAFTADSLMSLGCGRLFEGTPDQMWASLSKLMSLPDHTIMCSGHEYTLANAKFAVTIDPENPALMARIADIEHKRQSGQPTAQVPLSLEKQTNPFLRPHSPNIRAHLNMPDATDAQVFAEVRKRKDDF